MHTEDSAESSGIWWYHTNPKKFKGTDDWEREDWLKKNSTYQGSRADANSQMLSNDRIRMTNHKAVKYHELKNDLKNYGHVTDFGCSCNGR